MSEPSSGGRLSAKPRAHLTGLLLLTTACAIQAYAAPAHAELPPAPAAEVQPSAEARQQFQLGVSLLQDPDGARYEDAFKAFYRAYELSPSWKILGNIGLSAMKLERYTDGIEAYERYLAESGSNLGLAERQQIERDLSIMKGTTGNVTLLVSGASQVSLEDTRLRAVGGPIVNTYAVPAGGRIVLRLAAGKHTLVASGDGKSATLELFVKAGESMEKTLALGTTSAPPMAVSSASASAPTGDAEPSEGSSSTLRTTGLIVGGVGVAALIGGGITAFIGLGKKSDLDERCPNAECHYDSASESSAFQSDKDSLAMMGTLTTVLLAGGGVLTATGVTLYVVGAPNESERVSVAPRFGPGIAVLNAQGTF